MARKTEKGSNILGTRCEKTTFDKISKVYPHAKYDLLSKILRIENEEIKDKGKGTILIVTGGTSDIPVADEAYYTALFFGNKVERLYDVGVAGIHRLLNNRDIIEKFRRKSRFLQNLFRISTLFITFVTSDNYIIIRSYIY